MPAGVAAHGLSAGYARGEAAIVEISFAARGGQVLGVLAPNGGGKTTLLRALLGDVPARRGVVELEGTTAWVPQGERSRLDFPVNALDVALMGTYPGLPWYRRVGRRERAVAQTALERVGLGAVARTSYGALSAGERQRVLIARAVARDAEVLLLDEPLTGIDRTSGERILALVEDLRAEGRALLVATHDLRLASSFDLVLCLNRRLVAFGPPSQTLTPSVLEATYGSEMVVLEGRERTVAIQPHGH